MLREQAEHMDAPDRCSSLHKNSCITGVVHTWLNDHIIAYLRGCRGRPPHHVSLQKGGFAAELAKGGTTLPKGTPIEVWFQDEARSGQKNKITWRWAQTWDAAISTKGSATDDMWEEFGAHNILETLSTEVSNPICPSHVPNGCGSCPTPFRRSLRLAR
jgi:hypothetical protein